ncbi:MULTISPECIES: Na-translocating system protein MpsC family protein [Bacillaceae]|uniref:Na-translocating system protein MpsC family protein n=1 Tax=Bacillaceae TaxID=186817 RepID=UPI000BFB5723|nr:MULTISPECIES: Na-translocating system protein MpsC family protein [Bacillaceae]PGT82268.1 hypothetical protein COD11_15380 [Bacillus sp. AFS040349]UGB31386.1 DUF2294 domain-containing protein [Metabacillus sp. B2-18]
MKNVDNYYQEDLLLLSSTLSKLLKQRFGKGPETCYVTLHSNRLVIFIKKYITPAEAVLLKNNNVSLLQKFRSAVMEEVFTEFGKEAHDCLGISFDSYYDDWNFKRNTGIMILENSGSKEWLETTVPPTIRENLFNGIISVSEEIYKVPSRVEIIRMNQNMYAVECREPLIQIEKVLYRKGHIELLQERSNDIKNSFIKQKEVFESIFTTVVEDIFMIWDYKNDRSYIFFYLQ